METIGDAYMVVGGLPKPCDNHAEKVANMALGMMEAAEKVLSPVDKKPLKVSFWNVEKKETNFLGFQISTHFVQEIKVSGLQEI